MLIIKQLTPPPYKDLAILLRDAFTERLEQGLNFECANYDDNDIREKLSDNAVVLGAYENDILLGMVVLNSIVERKSIRFAKHEYLAVSSKAKHKGVGTALFKELVIKARNLNIDFILSDTAEQATSSVRYHKKNGFNVLGYSHYKGRTYNSVNFILPLSLKGRILTSWIGKKILRSKFTNR